MFGPLDMGPVITQVLANANAAGYDGQVTLPLYKCIYNDLCFTFLHTGYLLRLFGRVFTTANA